MKFLFDQNISPGIVKKANQTYPKFTHTQYVGLENAPDVQIFEYARLHGYTIVTFDTDFIDLQLINNSTLRNERNRKI